MKKHLEVALILASGAIGGLVSVVDAWQDPVSFPLSSAKLASLLFVPTLKGAIAAGIGVYLLTTVDSKELVRTLFFGVACGLTFPSVLSNSASYAQQITSRVATTQVVQNAERLREVAPQATSASSPSLAASGIAQVQKASLEIIEAAPKAQASEVKSADAAVQQAVSEIARTHDAASEPAAVDAIARIGAAAAAQNLPLTQATTLKELKAMQQVEGSSLIVRDRAETAVRQLESAAATVRP